MTLQIKWDYFGSLDEEDGKIGEQEPEVLQEDETRLDCNRFNIVLIFWSVSLVKMVWVI